MNLNKESFWWYLDLRRYGSGDLSLLNKFGVFLLEFVIIHKVQELLYCNACTLFLIQLSFIAKLILVATCLQVVTPPAIPLIRLIIL